MNKCFAIFTTYVSTPLFPEKSVERELELLGQEPQVKTWLSPTGEAFSFELPHTVYPPRQDTDFLARNILKLGPGKGRLCLEIGIGSGVLSLLCHRQGWNVSACDVNPIAVASAKHLLASNLAPDVQVREGGPGPPDDGMHHQWAGKNEYDLIFWNMPYIKLEDNSGPLLGPMEEAALIDTTSTSLVSVTLANIKSGNILSKSGVCLLTVGNQHNIENLVDIASQYGFAARVIDRVILGDGEPLKALAFWHPFADYPTLSKDEVSSTNTELLNSNWPIGSSLSANHQTHGRGRYQRKWENTGKQVSCSWKVKLPSEISTGLTQVIIGNQIKRMLSNYSASSVSKVILKWPNDVLIVDEHRWGKVCGVLIESVTRGKTNVAVVGIGINLAEGLEEPQKDFNIAYVNWLTNSATKSALERQVHCRIASLFEDRHELPNTHWDEFKLSADKSIRDAFTSCRAVLYRNQMVTLEVVNDDGTISLNDELGNIICCGEGEELNWEFL